MKIVFFRINIFYNRKIDEIVKECAHRVKDVYVDEVVARQNQMPILDDDDDDDDDRTVKRHEVVDPMLFRSMNEKIYSNVDDIVID
jgi:hypothetical protein